MMIGLGLSVCLGGGNGVAPPPTANMEAWFRKGVGITSAANAVSNWANQAVSGAARDLAQATGAAQPTLQGDGTILFDGTSDFMKTAAFTLNQPCTTYLRLKQVTWTTGRRIFDGNTVSSVAVLQNVTTPQLDMYAGTLTASNTTLTVNTWGSLAAVFNGASSALQISGQTETTGNAGASNAGGFTLGAAADGTVDGNIQVAEVIIYSAAHDATQRAAVFAYLNTL